MERISKTTESTDHIEILLEGRLDGIIVPEHIPEAVERLYRLEQLLIDLDTVDWNNEDRHLDRAAREALHEALSSESLSHMNYQNYQTRYRPVHPDFKPVSV